MRKLPMVFSFVLLFGVITFAQEKATHSDDQGKMKHESSMQMSGDKMSKDTSAAANLKPVNTVCPVSGEELEDFDHTIVYNGKTYAVCCNKCMAKIKKDPEKYISRLKEDGKSLKKS